MIHKWKKYSKALLFYKWKKMIEARLFRLYLIIKDSKIVEIQFMLEESLDHYGVHFYIIHSNHMNVKHSINIEKTN